MTSRILSESIPLGLCQCGCGERTAIAAKNDRSRHMVKGEPRRFRPHHNARVTNRPRRRLGRHDYRIEDRGYLTPCWIWQGAFKGNGYGQVGLNGSFTSAHNAFWEHFIGRVPKGLELDHLCRIRACVNPGHLQPVTHLENVRRGACIRYTDEEIAWVRSGVDYRIVRDTLGMSIAHIYDVRSGKARA